MKIRTLDEQTINQIAAGEVIENPASVVKELVENAVDAGASQIKVEIFSGGFQSIIVSDNGSGMSQEDALLCFTRHATSKIQKVEDLSYLSTMGFRGEALSSIAAISKVTLTTSYELVGLKLEVEAGRVLSIDPAPRLKGSSIEVRSLFYNVPARKKFQKSVSASSAEITKLMTFLSLAYPEIGLSLWHQDKRVFDFCASENRQEEMLARAKTLLSDDFVEDIHVIAHKQENYEVMGFVASPLRVRVNRSGQYLFVNRRVVVCPSFSYAVRDAFSTRIEKDRHPLFVLHCTMASHLIDVNVHPQKKEIRLKEEKYTKNLIRLAVERALEQRSRNQPSVSMSISSEHQESSFWRKEPFAHVLYDSLPKFKQESFIENTLEVIGLFSHYLFLHPQSTLLKIVEAKKAIAMIGVDLYAAESKILFDEMLKNQEPKGSQTLLLPDTVVFSKAEGEGILCILNELHQLGLKVYPIGEAAFLIEAIPEFMKQDQVRDLILECLQGSKEQGNRKYAAILCRWVRKNKQPFSQDKALRLVKQLLCLPDPLFCPLGKRIISCITQVQIDDWFK
ncbi:DNA mismatch repair endonuclease MutL [Candidatus Rhabdochlamydia porcellionis]|jgi:DNA mismatch repair protein MutL|nr:DNA mismatch repair endonuclease MutL [Candidatus Rhabdochlamydia porcellionis]